MPNPVLNEKTFQKAESQAGWAAPRPTRPTRRSARSP